MFGPQTNSIAITAHSQIAYDHDLHVPSEEREIEIARSVQTDHVRKHDKTFFNKLIETFVFFDVMYFYGNR